MTDTTRAASTGEFSIVFPHQVFYSNREPIPAAEIAEALLALEKIIHRAPSILRVLIPGASMPEAMVYVEEISSGSLLEKLIVRFAWGSERKMNRWIDRMKKKYGVTDANGMFRTVVLALILGGAYFAAQRYLTPQERAAVELSHNTIIAIGAQDLGMTAEEVRRIVEVAVSKKDQLAREAVAVVRPAKRDREARIVFDGQEAEAIPPEFIALVPSEVETEREEDSEIKPNVDIELRALDLDSHDHGWAAVIPALGGQRLRMELGPGIDAGQLFGKARLTGEVEIIRRKDPKGVWVPKLIRLLSIEQEE